MTATTRRGGPRRYERGASKPEPPEGSVMPKQLSAVTYDYDLQCTLSEITQFFEEQWKTSDALRAIVTQALLESLRNKAWDVPNTVYDIVLPKLRRLYNSNYTGA